MRAADIPVDEEGALGLCRLLLRAASSSAIDAASTSEKLGNAASTRHRHPRSPAS